MKKTFTLLLFFVYLFTPLSLCLFSQNPNRNISLNENIPNKIVLESSGNKFLTWNINSQINMYNINGTLICNTTYPQQIQRIIWPTQYYPIVLPFPGIQITTLNYTNCEILKIFDLKIMTNITNTTDQISQITFMWLNGGPYVALSALISVWQIDLSSISLVNAYLTMDQNLPRYQSTAYSKDYKNIYVVMTDANSGVRTVRVWQTKTKFGKPIRQITFSTSVSSMTPSNDNSSIICVGSSIDSDDTKVYRLGNDGVIKEKTTRSDIVKAITIGNGNTVALFQTGKGIMELVSAGNGQSMQITNFTYSNYFFDADFQNNLLIILDSSSRVLTYSYTPDEDVQPIPNPIDPGQSSPIWIIIVSVIFGILIFVVVLMYVFQQKLPLGLRKKLPKCFNSKKTGENQSLIVDSPSQQSVQQNPIPQPSNVIQNPPQGPYQNPPPAYRPPNNNIFQGERRQKDGIPPGMNDAQIMQAMKKQDQRRRREQLQRRRLQEIYERQERERKYRQQQEERQKRQMQYRRQKEWEEQQRLMEIQRRRREEFQKQRIKKEEAERLKRQQQARRYYEFQRMEEERKRIQMENKRQQEIRRIQYQRYLQEQERRKYQPYQPSYQQYPQYSSNPNIYVPPPQYNQPYNPNIQILPKNHMSQPQNQKMNFVDERKNLVGGRHEEKPDQMEEIDNDEIPVSKSFFVVKRKDPEVENLKNNGPQGFQE